jgi:phage tail-like protein
MRNTDPLQVYNFLIEIDGLVVGGFAECSGLAAETEIYEYREGGMNDFMHTFVGPTKYTPLVLRRGMSASNHLWEWYQEVISQGVNSGRGLRRSGTIYLLDEGRNTVKAWNFSQGLPYKWNGAELRADSSEVAFESLELAHRGLHQAIL